MTEGGGSRKRGRGEIETLPSGSLRVRVYSGRDPVTGKRHYLVQTVPPGPRAAKEAEKLRTKFLAEVDERRNPRSRATVNQLMDRHFELLQVDKKTRRSYERYLKNHIRPLLGKLSVAKLDGEVLDSFHAQLRTCRAHCRGRPLTDHRTTRDHECDQRCRPHQCRPLATSSIRQIHGILSSALRRAVRWRWIGTSPIEQADPPAAVRSEPDPPTAEEAARIVNEAWKDPDWGMLVWLAMVTGARRGELCAITWHRLDLSAGVLTIRTSIAQSDSETWEKETKTHQQRRLTLDAQTVALLRAYRQRWEERAEQLGFTLPDEGRVFSRDPDGSTWIRPDTVTQRYRRMCARIGLDQHLHQLRHYSATELIAAGVDVRTVAGRLGHGGGGATTLRVYSAWRSEADQRAAGSLAGRMPALPVLVDAAGAGVTAPQPVPEQSAPYLRIAADLRAAIACGALKPGDQLPTVKALQQRYGVAAGTAHRAVALLAEAGEVEVARGQRAKVAAGRVP